LINIWEKKQEKEWAWVFKKAQKRLQEGGLLREAIRTEFKPMEINVADDILNETETSRYGTIVLGRRGQTGLKKILPGSVAARILPYAPNGAEVNME
jgi:nucleotide-binding universal stress UspA family protein